MRGDWNNLKTVLYMVRHGSLANAASALGVSHTTVSRRIADAEAGFGTPLFERLPAGYSPTQAGYEAAARAAEMEREVFDLERRIGGSDEFEGPLVITAPQLLIASHLCGVIDDYISLYPKIELSVLASNEILNLNANEADLAIRISNAPGDMLIGQRLARQETASFASADLAARMAAEPQNPVDWLGLVHWKGPPIKAQGRGRIKLRFNDMIALIGAAQAGLGVARMPVFVGRAAKLAQVPVLAPQPYADIWALTHRDMKNAAKITALRALLVPYFRNNAAAFVA